MIIPIQEVFTWPERSVALRVYEGQVELDVGASFMASLLDKNDRVTVDCGRSALSAAQYASWLGNDADVARMVAENLGFIPVPPQTTTLP